MEGATVTLTSRAALPGSEEDLRTYNLRQRSISVEKPKFMPPVSLGVFGPVRL